MAYHKVEGESELESSTSSTMKKQGPLKVILIGRKGVGKSTLYLRIRDGKFYEDVHNQMIDYFDKTIFQNNNRSVEMRLYDTGNMEWHEGTVTRSYYLGSRLALIVYSVDEMDSVDDLKTYIHDVLLHAPNAKLFLVRNKIDKEDQTVQEDEVEDKLRNAGYHFKPNCKYSTSAKKFEGDGIDNLIQAIGQVLIKQSNARQDSTQRSLHSFQRERHTSDNSHSKKCC